MLFLRDRDELPGAAIASLEGAGPVHVLERRELENYLLDEDALTAVAPGSNGPVTLDELRRAADDQRDRVLAKRVVAAVPIVRLFPRSEVAALGPHPSKQALVDLARRQVPDVEEVARIIAETWTAEEAGLANEWAENRLALAPGEEVLSQVWASRGGAFDKGRDGPAIAAAMEGPPGELEAAIKTFVGLAP